MRVTHILISCLASLFCASTHAFAAEAKASVRGILVLASNEKAGTDARLAPFEPNLRRILRFESYRHAGEGSASVSIPGKASLSIGRGHKLEIEPESASDGTIKARVTWTGDGKALMNTVLVLRRGVPAILGGPSSGGPGGEVFAVIVIAD
jgi:hypothetical protein